MLYYKAWLESRVRFFAAAAVLSIYCVTFIQQARVNFPPVFEPALTYTAYVWRGIYDGIDTVVFVIVAAMLGLGGVERERESGSSAFTLALPVTRLHLLRPRVAVAMLEMAALAVIPLLVVPWTSASIGRAYPTGQAAQFATLFAVTGALWVSAGVLASVICTGSHSSIVASLLAPATCAAVFAGTGLRRHAAFNPFSVMNGARLPFLNRTTGLVDGSLPWTALVAFLLVSAALIGLTAAVASRKDF